MADRLRQNPDDLAIEDEDFDDDLPGALADDDEDDLDLEDEE
jgi:hypothetical protein